MTKTSIAVAAWLGTAAALSSFPLDGYLDQVQWRFFLLHLPAWVLLGVVAGLLFRRPGPRTAPMWDGQGFGAVVFFLGTLTFWMIPRSVDTAVSTEWVDQLMHLNLLVGGFFLTRGFALLPFVVRGALGIYAVSMTFALGNIYAKYDALLCGTFTLAQQREAGRYLLLLCPAVLALVLVLGARALAHQHHLESPTPLPAKRGEVG